MMPSISSPLAVALRECRVAFLADYASAVGLGHLVRCSSLAKALQLRGVEVFFTGVKPPAFLKIDVPHISAPTAISEWPNWASAVSARALILDSYLLSDEERQVLRQAFPIFIALDDQRGQWIADADLVLNPSPLAEREDYRKRAPFAHTLLGPEYTLLGPSFSKAAPAWLQRSASILVTFGGADPGGLTAPTCQRLLDLLPQDVGLDVVLPTEFSGALPCTDRLRTYQGLADLAGLMRSARLAVTQVGGTMGELAFSGVPAVVGVTAQSHASLLKEHRQFDWCTRVDLIHAGHQAPLLLAEAACRAWDDAQMLIRQSQLGPQIVDGRGSERVAERIDALIKRAVQRGGIVGCAEA